jgi:hypothetical protein
VATAGWRQWELLEMLSSPAWDQACYSVESACSRVVACRYTQHSRMEMQSSVAMRGRYQPQLQGVWK